MNPEIQKLAKRPRGKKWCSRLEPYDADIRRMRQSKVSYQDIAEWLKSQGLTISGSAVHAYVRARAKRGGSEYRLPSDQSVLGTLSHADYSSPLDKDKPEVQSTSDSTSPPEKEFIYRPPQPPDSTSDDNLNFNNPLD